MLPPLRRRISCTFLRNSAVRPRALPFAARCRAPPRAAVHCPRLVTRPPRYMRMCMYFLGCTSCNLMLHLLAVLQCTLALAPKHVVLLDEPGSFLGASAVESLAASLAPDAWPGGALVVATNLRSNADALRPTHTAVLSERRVVLCQQWAAKMPSEVTNTLAHEMVRRAPRARPLPLQRP